jgi:hypothetical protein
MFLYRNMFPYIWGGNFPEIYGIYDKNVPIYGKFSIDQKITMSTQTCKPKTAMLRLMLEKMR